MNASRLAVISSVVGTAEGVSLRLVYCSILANRRRSWGVYSVRAMPVRPARPVRPMRCTYTSAKWGISKLKTWEMSSMSNPRAATSVATKTLILPSRKRPSTFSRASWLKSPLSASAGMPRPVNSLANKPVSTRVRAKIRALVMGSISIRRVSAATLSFSFTK